MTPWDPNDKADDELLSRLGYKKVLDRGLGALGNFAFGFSEVAVLASITSLYGQGLRTGGPSASIWGFLVVWLMNSIVATNMAEICSAYPSAGSVYHWAAQVVPERHAPLASYICGWTNWIGNASGNAAFAYSFAIFLNAALQASHLPSYDTSASSVIIALGVNTVWTLLNWINISHLAMFNNFAAFFHAGSLLAIVIILFATAHPLRRPSWVFFDYENFSGFTDDMQQRPLNDKSYVGAMGVLTACYYFSGYEASAHMAEETSHSTANAPNGIIYTVLATGFGGFIYILALLFATTDLDAAMATDDALMTYTSCEAVNVFIMACGRSCGASLSWLVVINLFFAGISCVAVTGRITFALMRDNVFPHSDYFKQVDPVLKSPRRAVTFVLGCVSLLLLLPLNPDAVTAFNNIVGLCTIGFQISYAIPIVLKCYFCQSLHFPRTAKTLGVYSVPLGVISSVWLLGTSCLFFFPVSGPLTVKTNNWLIVVVGGVCMFAALYWYCGNGRSRFLGPNRSQNYDDVQQTGSARNPLHVDWADCDIVSKMENADLQGAEPVEVLPEILQETRSPLIEGEE